MAKAPFVSLHNHTEMGSPLDGMNDVYELFNQAKELDHRSIAITDHGTLTAHFDAWKASKASGVKLIPGQEFYFAPDMTVKKSNHLVLLAKNHNGYKNILKLNYEAYKNQVSGYMGKKTPRISWNELSSFSEDVICLTACSNGLLSKALIAEDNEELAVERMLKLQKIFGENLFLELQPHSLKTDDGKVDQIRLNQTLVRLSRDYGINYTITCDAHYLDKEHAKYHDMMLAIKDKKSFDDPNRFRYGVQDMYLKNHQEIIDFFGRDIAETGMRNSLIIDSQVEIPSYLEPSGPILPKFKVKEESDYSKFLSWKKKKSINVDEDKSYLRYKCIEGFNSKLKELNKKDKVKYWDRVKSELSVLESRDFSSYMLIVSDYVNWAKKNKITVGPGRGSVAGSLISYLIGITSIDPIKYGLMFERFHNKEKKSFPDIDSDFAKPDLVKKYLKEKYGEDKVAYISNWSTLSPKVIIKDVARSLRLGGDKSSAFKIANHITSIMPDTKTIEEAKESSKEFSKYMDNYPELYKNAIKLQGLTRNWGVHAAGIVISDKPLCEIIPLRIDQDGNTVTQWEKTRCEEFGLIKMDLLGLKTLTVINSVLKSIEDNHDKSLSLDDIPLDDKKTYNMISRGDNIGVFQLESSLSPICKRVKPTNVQMVSDINALGRPSCSPKDRSNYVKRRLGSEPASYLHSCLESSLSDTYGISLYEEGMMKIAKNVAGWDLNQADALRKITKLKGKNPELVLKTEASFLKDSMEHSGLKYEEALDIWNKEIMPFGQYGFNKAHSISYSHISVQTAWLKANYPTEFMTSLLNSENPNSEKALEYLNECSKLSISVSPANINHSKRNYNILSDKKIVAGLSSVKGVGDKAIESILKSQPFSSFSDFLTKTEGRVVNKGVIQSLSKSGALDEFGLTRKDMCENYAKYRTRAVNFFKKNGSLDEYSESIVSEDEWDNKTILLFEKDILGRAISGSIHNLYKNYFSNNKSMVTYIRNLSSKSVGEKIKLEIIINSKIKEFKIKNGKNVGKKFAKYLVEDINGDTAELTLWNSSYERYNSMLKDGIPAKAICKVGEYMSSKTLSLVRFESIFSIGDNNV